MDVHPSARRHGATDADIAHAITHHVYLADLSDQGPRRASCTSGRTSPGTCWVVVIERDDGTDLEIHAMPMRKQYEELLRGER